MSLYRILLDDGQEMLMDLDPGSPQALIYVRIADDWVPTPYVTADAHTGRIFHAACLVAAYVHGGDPRDAGVARVVRLTGAAQAT